MALTPFEPPTVIVFQIGVSKAVGVACGCVAAIRGADALTAGEFGHCTNDCAAAGTFSLVSPEAAETSKAVISNPKIGAAIFALMIAPRAVFLFVLN
jgi:hypothetical protein